VEEGTHDLLLEKDGIYHDLYEKQMQIEEQEENELRENQKI
jgi:hypothetical protein